MLHQSRNVDSRIVNQGERRRDNVARSGDVDQFTRLRDGDRFWYEIDPALSRSEIAALKKTRLSDVIKRNTKIKKLQKNVFVV